MRVKWVNELVDENGHYPPAPPSRSIPTLHWANPGGGIAGRDTTPS